MLSIKVKRGQDNSRLEEGMIPARFRQFVLKKERRLNNLSPEAKVVAALTKCLAMQGQSDGKNYYVAGDQIYCPIVDVTEGSPKKPGGMILNSYSAQGRFKIGKSHGDRLGYGIMEFRLKFRDGEDEMGLPDIVIEEADMSELPRNAPLRG